MTNPTFQITFTAALVPILLAAVLQRRHGPGIAARWTVAALVLYGIVLAVTFGLHIPLNNDIDQAGDLNHITDLAQVRDDVERPWVVWNIPRTLLHHRGGRRPRPRPPSARTQHQPTGRHERALRTHPRLPPATTTRARLITSPAPTPRTEQHPMTEDLTTAGTVAAAIGCACWWPACCSPSRPA